MKVIFDKAELLAALIPAAGISQVKNTLTTIEGLLFECPPDPRMGDFDGDASNMCRISAFDLEKGLRTSLECRIFEEGKYVINTSKILQIVRALPDGDITLDIDENLRAEVSGGNSSFEISVSRGEDFPTMPMFKGERRYTFPQHVVRDMISQSIFSAAVNDQRAAFNGELMKITDGKMTLVGCDGNRLSCVSCDVDADLPECEIIIPTKFMMELQKMLRDTEDEVEMIIGLKHIIFRMESLYFFCRMIDSKFMDYSRILPRSFASEAYLSPVELRDALDRASIISEDKLGGNSKAVVKLVFSGNRIDISSVSTSGSIYETVDCALTGNDIVIGFSCRMLLDALRSIPADVDRIRIGLNDSLKGICIEPSYGSPFVTLEGREERILEDGENAEFCHYIMPRRMHG